MNRQTMIGAVTVPMIYERALEEVREKANRDKPRRRGPDGVLWF